jgi:hypothetical protein
MVASKWKPSTREPEKAWCIHANHGEIFTTDGDMASNAEGMFGLRVEDAQQCNACRKYRRAIQMVQLPSYVICEECVAVAVDIFKERQDGNDKG